MPAAPAAIVEIIVRNGGAFLDDFGTAGEPAAPIPSAEAAIAAVIAEHARQTLGDQRAAGDAGRHGGRVTQEAAAAARLRSPGTARCRRGRRPGLRLGISRLRGVGGLRLRGRAGARHRRAPRAGAAEKATTRTATRSGARLVELALHLGNLLLGLVEPG